MREKIAAAPANGDDPAMNATLHPFAARRAADDAVQPKRSTEPSCSARHLAAEHAFAHHHLGEHVEVVELADWQVDADRQEWWRPLRVRLKAQPDLPVWLIFTVRFLEGEGAAVQGAHATDHTGAPWGVAREAADVDALDAADGALLLAALECHGEGLARSAAAAAAQRGEAAVRLAALRSRLSRMTTGA